MFSEKKPGVKSAAPKQFVAWRALIDQWARKLIRPEWIEKEASHVCARDTQPGRAVSPVLEPDLDSRLHGYSGATPVCATALVLNRQGNPDEPALHGEPYGNCRNR